MKRKHLLYRKKPFVVIAALLLVSAPLISQTTDAEKKEETAAKEEAPVIVVSASRIAMQKQESGANITVITAKDIETSGYTDLTTLIKGIEGIHLAQSGSFGGQTSIFMRGGKSGNVAVLVDGVKLNHALSVGRAYDMSHIRLSDIERIEITRGANSTTFGSEATGGVIQIITKKGNANRLSFGVEGGSFISFREHREQVSWERTFGKISFNLGVSADNSDGISKSATDSETDPYRNYTVSAALRARPEKNMLIDFSARYIDALTSIDDSATAGDPDRHNISRTFVTAASFQHEPLPWLSYTAAVDYMMYNFADVDPGESSYESTIHVPHGRAALEFHMGGINTVLIGGEWLLENGQDNSGIAFGTTANGSRFTQAYYLQDSLKFFNRIFINAGIRADINTAFGFFLSYNASGSFIIPVTETNLKVNWGVGHRMPTIYELYNSTNGNSALKPESSMTVDAGLVQPLWHNKISLGGFFFYGEHDNAITWGFPNYYNASSREIYMGVESYVEVKPVENVSIRGTYTWTDSRQADGSRSLKRPEHQGSLSVTALIINKIDLSTRLLVVGDRRDYSSYPTVVTLPWYIKWDLSVGYRFENGIKIFLRGENLTNAVYHETWNYAMPGISVFAGIRAVM